MPTTEIQFSDLEQLVGVQLPRDLDDLNETLALIKAEASLIEGRQIHEESGLRVELKDTNRPDLWAVEGMARALRGLMGVETGLKKYRVRGSSGVTIKVDGGLRDVRPFIACAVVRGTRLSNSVISGLMQLQDRLDESYGRRRRRTSIGLYDFDLVTPPLTYGLAEPREASFTPLGFSYEMTLEEILARHPKGLEYGNIVKQYPRWPLLFDSMSKVLSFPPIVNSNDLGKITEDTRNLLVEVTGTVNESVVNTLIMMVTVVLDRGGRLYTSTIRYPYGRQRVIITPNMDARKMRLDMKYVQHVLGLKLSPRQIKRSLRRARFHVGGVKGSVLQVNMPCYRLDVMHPVDLVEDIAVAHGLDRFSPRWPQLVTTGDLSPRERYRDLARGVMMGLGFQEVLTFSLTSPEKIFDYMNLNRRPVVEVANPRMTTFTCLRSWLLPSLMEVLSHNKGVRYPQRIFEVGDCVTSDESLSNRARDSRRLAAVNIHAQAGVTELKSQIAALFLNLGKQYEVKPTRHLSFIEGRTGDIELEGKAVGIFGEIHPKVLEMWGLENPAAAFELELDAIGP